MSRGICTCQQNGRRDMHGPGDMPSLVHVPASQSEHPQESRSNLTGSPWIQIEMLLLAPFAAQWPPSLKSKSRAAPLHEIPSSLSDPPQQASSVSRKQSHWNPRNCAAVVVQPVCFCGSVASWAGQRQEEPFPASWHPSWRRPLEHLSLGSATYCR